MKKLISLITIIIIIASFSISSFAATAENPADNTAVTQASAETGNTGDNPAVTQASAETGNTGDNPAVTQASTETGNTGDNPADTQKSIDNNIAADKTADMQAAAVEKKSDKVSKETAKAFKGKLADQFAHLNKLREECDDLWSQIKAANESIKAAMDALKASLKDKDKEEAKKILEAVKAEVEPITAQIKAIRTDIQKLRDEKKAEWASFGEAVKRRDEAKAAAALDTIIDLKSQIIEKQKEMLPLKEQVLEAIK